MGDTHTHTQWWTALLLLRQAPSYCCIRSPWFLRSWQAVQLGILFVAVGGPATGDC
jgi:hypothetical protein